MITDEDYYVILIAKERSGFVWIDYIKHLVFRFRLRYNIFLSKKERIYKLEEIEDFTKKLRRNIW